MKASYESNERYQVVPFLPVNDEATFEDLEVTGSIPTELDGVFVRNGPNPIGAIPPVQHYFSGHGMVHGVRLHGGHARWYRRRYVRGGDVAERLGEPDIGGPVAHEVDASPNTNLMRLNGQLYATIEGGPNPVALSPELDSIARSNLDGALSYGFTGHHKIDPSTGELHGIVYSMALPARAQYLRLSPQGARLNAVEVPLTGATQIHDMAITERFVIVLDLSVVFDPSLLERTTLPIRWDGDKPARVGVLPMDGSAADIQWFHVDPCYVYHPMNAFETAGGNVVLDVSRYPRAAERDPYGPLGDSLPTLDRWVLRMDGSTDRAVESRLSGLPLDFPTVNPAVQGRPYRYGYAVRAGLEPSFGGAVRLDLRTGDVLEQPLDEGSTSELTFVPRKGATDEDDGWLLAFVYQPASQRSRLVILDGHDFGGDPVASVWIPGHHIPIGTHGGWFAA